MKRGFRIVADALPAFINVRGSQLRLAGRVLSQQDTAVVAGQLAKYLSPDGALDAESITQDWFGEIRADIFLSHSHGDLDLALELAAWLQEDFGLRVFIDSCVWGNIEALQREIDVRHCLNPGGRTYSYELRNQSTAHVHMMLAGALANMIHRTPYFVLLRSHNSISVKDTIQGNPATMSPWIFFELALSAALAREEEMTKAATESDLAKSLRVRHRASIGHLDAVEQATLAKWHGTWVRRGRTGDALSLLCDLVDDSQASSRALLLERLSGAGLNG